MARNLLPHITPRSPLVTLVVGFFLGVSTAMLFIALLAVQSPAHHLLELESIQRVATASCDQSLEKLKRLAKVALYRGQITVNQSCFTDNTPSIPRANVTELRQFLYPSKGHLADRRDGVPLGTPQRLNQEYLQRKNLLIGVLTQQEYLRTRAKVVYETWSADVDDVVFFVGEDCNISADLAHLPIVKLSGIPDHVYPPLRKAFAVLQYMYDHFTTDYNWFVRADDDMYVRGRKLQKLLHELHPFENIYMGRAGVGREEDMGRLRLLPHERYCMGGPGVIFSNAAMRGLGPHLNNCLEAVFYHDKHSHGGDWNDDDVEIGRCLSRYLDVQCSTSEESRLLFRTDYVGDSLNPLLLWTKKELEELITLHPVKNPDNMRSIHHFYQTLDFEMIYEDLYNMSSSINALCRSLPPHLSPPLFASPGCNLHMQQHRLGNRSGSAGSYITTNKKMAFHNPSSKYDLAQWKTFTSYYEYEASATAPQHILYPSFKAEIMHLMSLVQAYLNANSRSQKRIQIEDIMEGYTRFNPSTGREYILHLEYSELNHPDSVKHKTLRLLRPLSPEISVSEIDYTPQTVHVILPLETVDDKLSQFLLMYQEDGLSYHQKLHLVMVVFASLDAASAEKITQTLGFHDAQITIVRGEGNFSFVQAIEVGMDVVKESDALVFITTVDVRIKYRFYRRCHLHALFGKSVYYPIPFNWYSSDYTYNKETSVDVVPQFLHWSGQWPLHTFNSLCIHKQDYKNLGRFERSSSVHLFERIIKSPLELIQAPDPALSQIWPAKACSSLKENSLQRNACQQLRQVALFDHTDLAQYLAELSQKRNNPITFTNKGD